MTGNAGSFALLRPAAQAQLPLACVPAGTGTDGIPERRKAGGPDGNCGSPDARQTALLLATGRFALRIQAPAQAGMGFFDTIGCSAGIWAVLHRNAGPKEALPMIACEHDHLAPKEARVSPAGMREALDVLLGGGESKPRQLEP